MYYCAWPTWLPDVTSSNVTWPRSDSLGRVGCAHAQPKIAQYPPYCGLFTGSDVIKCHVTPKRFPWKGGVRACATGSCAIFALVGTFHRKWYHQTSRDPSWFPWNGVLRTGTTGSCAISDQTSPVGLPLENMGARMRYRKYPWGAL